ncbi:uncharacterized protein EI97DRAFT_490462 [Westerdykella ornata]|uniref:Uncharacterized protein n=1 Tax=Westerdykella ornata TaxID=318751 RepID=A0A6A6JKT5_WESOR|nr:uncharacterized protein EI97DRAFT_490462 [Westerdykella ornata]KAF2276874.1 hypothetical protein EI97DRAFT_490462 [Westerdykella ornata]
MADTDSRATTPATETSDSGALVAIQQHKRKHDELMLEGNEEAVQKEGPSRPLKRTTRYSNGHGANTMKSSTDGQAVTPVAVDGNETRQEDTQEAVIQVVISKQLKTAQVNNERRLVTFSAQSSSEASNYDSLGKRKRDEIDPSYDQDDDEPSSSSDDDGDDATDKQPQKRVASKKHQATLPPRKKARKTKRPPTSLAPAPLPTPPLSQNEPCPIDLENDARYSNLNAEEKDTYLLRAPWKPKEDHTWTAIQALLNGKYNRGITSESYRKKFAKVNRAVFKATGAYWRRELFGLEECFDVKSLRPPTVVNGLAIGNGNTGSMIRGAAARDPRAVRYAGKTLTVHITEPGSRDGTLGFTRELPLTVFLDAAPAFARLARHGAPSLGAEFPSTTPRLADLLFGCHMAKPPVLHNRNASHCLATSLETGQRLIRDRNDELVYMPLDIKVSLSDTFELYLLAARAGNTHVRNLIVDHWREMTKQEVAQKLHYRNEEFWYDVPAELPEGITEFEPQHLNDLWTSEILGGDDGSRVRKFWLDVLRVRYRAALPKITSELSEYSREFLSDWLDRLESEDAVKVSNMMQGHEKPSTIHIPQSRKLKTQTAPGIPDPDLHPLLNAPPHTFCATYHIHASREPSCYLTSSQPQHPSNPPSHSHSLPVSTSPRPRQAHHVHMTLPPIHGYTIINHTGLPNQDFQRLPLRYPQWDWPRIRAVVWSAQPLDGRSACRAVWDYRPMYFDGGLEGTGRWRDEWGRWPCHPGWRDAAWKAVDCESGSGYQRGGGRQDAGKRGAEVREVQGNAIYWDFRFPMEKDAGERGREWVYGCEW